MPAAWASFLQAWQLRQRACTPNPCRARPWRCRPRPAHTCLTNCACVHPSCFLQVDFMLVEQGALVWLVCVCDCGAWGQWVGERLPARIEPHAPAAQLIAQPAATRLGSLSHSSLANSSLSKSLPHGCRRGAAVHAARGGLREQCDQRSGEVLRHRHCMEHGSIDGHAQWCALTRCRLKTGEYQNTPRCYHPDWPATCPSLPAGLQVLHACGPAPSLQHPAAAPQRRRAAGHRRPARLLQPASRWAGTGLEEG